MIRIVLEHAASFLLVVLISLATLAWVKSWQQKTSEAATVLIAPYLRLDSIDVADPLQALLLKETLERFYPSQASFRDSVLRALDAYRVKRITDAERKAAAPNDAFSSAMVARLGRMYGQFVAVFLVSILSIFLGARMIAVYRFIRTRQGINSALTQLVFARTGRDQGGRLQSTLGIAALCGRALLKGIGFLVLFSPAYVVAYALKIEINSGNLPMMVLLAVFSNGVLINYSNKFYTFLVQESRKGYVETAIAKGLESEYRRSVPWISDVVAAIVPRRRYSNHVFYHIYMNARFQFVSSVKELADFLVTGLMIIEMALNIQGHLCYQLLQSLLFHQYEIAVVIGIGIYLVVKVTEMAVDLWHEWEARKFRNGLGAQ